MDETTVHDTMAQELVSRGLATTDQVATSRAGLVAELASGEGYDPLAIQSRLAATATAAEPTAVPGGEDDDGSAFSAAAFAGPSSPSGYHFDSPPPGAKLDLEAQAAWRNALHAEGVAAPLAREMDRRLMRGLVSPPSQQQGALSQQAGMQTLAKIWGAEHRDANLAVAQREVQRLALRRPELIAMLNTSGLGNDPWLAVTLVNHARAKGRA